MVGKELFELSKKDVERLIEDSSASVRADTAAKIAKTLDNSKLNEKEIKIAEDIIRIFVKDTEITVRQILSENLKHNTSIPKDIAFILARDVEEVALPILRYSEVLSSEDLVEIINSGNEQKNIAIASRNKVEEIVSKAITEKASEEAVFTLISNDGAKISESSFENVIKRFPKSKKLQTPMAERANLPPRIVEKLIAVVSEDLREKLTIKYGISSDIISDILLRAQEEATIMMSFKSDEEELLKMIRQMHENQRLTPSLIIRAICMGDMKFFEFAMSEISSIPVQNCRVLIHDSGSLGFTSLYEKTALPARFFPIFRIAVDVLAENDFDGGCDDMNRFARRNIERILIKIAESDTEMNPADVEYLLGRLNLLPLPVMSAI